MLWSVQDGSIILVLPEIGYSVVKVEGFWILPLTYNRHENSIFESKLENILFEGYSAIIAKPRVWISEMSNVFQKDGAFSDAL